MSEPEDTIEQLRRLDDGQSQIAENTGDDPEIRVLLTHGISKSMASLLFDGGKAITGEERRWCVQTIEALDAALDLNPAIKLDELTTRAAELDVIRTSEERAATGQLRGLIVAALKQVKSCTAESVKRWHEGHKRKKAWENEYCKPLEEALATVTGIIEMDLQEQARIAEEERKEAQRLADEKARVEQIERERIACVAQARANAIAEEERQKRLALQKIADAAKSKKAQEAAALALKAQQEREAAAKEAQRQAEIAQRDAQRVIAAPVIEMRAVEKVAGIAIVKGQYRGRVVDIRLVPEIFLMPREADQKAIDRECVKRGSLYLEYGKLIPGVQVYFDNGGVKTKSN